MEDFNINYYAHHVRFMLFLNNNYEKVSKWEECNTEFSSVTKEALFRDIASRAFYTAFLKARDELSLGQGAMHDTVRKKLSRQYEQMFRNLREFRVLADYYADEEFMPPFKTERGTQYFPQRIVAEMEKFLAADYNTLTP